MNPYNAVIAAISTPPGKGGVALIRLSGEGAFAVADRVFLPKSKKKLSDYPPRYQVWGDIFAGGVPIDDGMATRFAAPASYTGEDTVEITCHGGALLTEEVLSAVFAAGAIPAGPGEFTRRAFVNGKLSLTDAESIGGLIDAVSEDQIKLHTARSRDALSKAIDGIRAELVSLLGSVYARIDYPDEDLGDFTDEESARILLSVREKLDKLLTTYRTGHAVAEGVRTVLCGKVNVGKSSLYNLLVGEEAAIVTDVEGTTRDVLEHTALLGRVMLRLFDTAGVRETADAVEKIGVERSRASIRSADLILAVFDGSRPQDAEDMEIIRMVREASVPAIALINKSDLQTKLDISDISAAFSEVIAVSAKQNGDLAKEALTKTVSRLLTDETLVIGDTAILHNARQFAALTRAKEAVNLAIEAYASGFAADAASSDVERAIESLSEVDGKRASEDVVADIFARFCVGK